MPPYQRLRADPRLCSELFLIAWDTTRSGRPRIHRTGAGLMLAGGLLAELIMANCLRVDGEHLAVVGHEPTQDPLLKDALRLIMEEAGRHTQLLTWLSYFGRE